MRTTLRFSPALAAMALALAIAATGTATRALAQDLHVDASLKECDIRFAPELTQDAFERFTREAGDIVVQKTTGTEVLRPGGFEFGLAYSHSPIEQKSDAWNDTFAHPDDRHELGDAIAMPSLYLRAGLGRSLEVGGYFTGNPEASYRFAGLGFKYGLPSRAPGGLGLAASLDYGLLFGPDDVMVHALGGDLHASRTWGWLTAHASGGVTFAHAEETSPVVDLATADTVAPHASVGASPRLWGPLRIDVLARFASVQTYEARIGTGF